MGQLRTTRIVWRRSYRIIPARYPPIALFERVAEASDWDALLAVESLTNDRIRDEVGDIALVPPHQRVHGAGASWVMGAFTHIGWPSRFSDGSYGVYYAARTQECSIAETIHHHQRFLGATREPVCTTDMRVLVGGIDGALHDVRSSAVRNPRGIYDRDDYSASQAFARRVRTDGAGGIAYRSVRLIGGECAAAFQPTVIRPLPRAERFLSYHWNGRNIDRYWDHTARKWLSPPSTSAL